MKNPLVHVPAAWPVLARMNDLRRQAVGRVRSVDMIRWDDIGYGDDMSQRLKLWELNDLCPRDGWPTVLLLHGGGWVEGSADEFESFAPRLVRKGLMAGAVAYRLGPEHRWPTQLEDVLGAIAFLREQQVDTSRIALWGHSAGGHLAMMAALARPDWVRCVVAVGAPSDLRELQGVGASTVDMVFDEDQLEGASPLCVPCEAPPPMLLVHGQLDPVCDISHARAHAAARPDTVTLREVPDGDHGLRWPPRACARAKREAIAWMVEQMDLPQRGSKWRRRKKKKR